MTKATAPDAGKSSLRQSTAVGPLKKVYDDVADALTSKTQHSVMAAELELDVPPTLELGDLAFRCFALAKKKQSSPAEVANDLASQLSATTYVDHWQAVGPYVNIFLKRQAVADLILKEIQKSPNYGKGNAFAKEKIVLEYVQPNTNKPLHLGHLRNALLGWSTAELLEAQGATVVKTNIVNDRGIHIAKSMLAYERWGKGETPESTGEKGDHFVGRWYVRFEQEVVKEKQAWLSDDPKRTEEDFLAASALMHDAQELLKRWEASDPGVRKLWRTMNDWVLDGFAATYKAIGIDFTKEYFESDIYESGRKLVLNGLKKGVFRKEANGAVVAPLKEKFGLPEKILLRGDGTALYITQDLALAARKKKDYKPKRSMYVVGSEQEMYFRQLFAVLELLGFATMDRLVHLSYGLVFLPEGKMKSREGKVVDADDLLAEMVRLTTEELATRYPDLGDEERASRAKTIALAAIKFHFLMVGRTSPVHFNPKESLSFEGKTGPYLQYSYARASSILAKAGAHALRPAAPAAVEDAEWRVLLGLLNHPRTSGEAAASYNPALLANALIGLAQHFNALYHELPVLKAAEDLRDFRLSLVAAFRQVMQGGLKLLGIEMLEVM